MNHRTDTCNTDEFQNQHVGPENYTVISVKIYEREI